MGRATEAIDNNLTLDKEQSALSRLKRELLDVLSPARAAANSFQSEVKASLAEIRAETRGGSPLYGTRQRLRRSRLGICATGSPKDGRCPKPHRKQGGCDEELQDGGRSHNARRRHRSIRRKDRYRSQGGFQLRFGQGLRGTPDRSQESRAAIGLFVFSRTTAPVGQETLLRHGNDIFSSGTARIFNPTSTSKQR